MRYWVWSIRSGGAISDNDHDWKILYLMSDPDTVCDIYKCCCKMLAIVMTRYPLESNEVWSKLQCEFDTVDCLLVNPLDPMRSHHHEWHKVWISPKIHRFWDQTHRHLIKESVGAKETWYVSAYFHIRLQLLEMFCNNLLKMGSNCHPMWNVRVLELCP